MIRLNVLRAALAEKGLAQWRLARRLGYEPSTFSDYLRGARSAPPNFGPKIEKALGLPVGALSEQKASQP